MLLRTRFCGRIIQCDIVTACRKAAAHATTNDSRQHPCNLVHVICLSVSLDILLCRVTVGFFIRSGRERGVAFSSFMSTCSTIAFLPLHILTQEYHILHIPALHWVFYAQTDRLSCGLINAIMSKVCVQLALFHQ